VYAVVHDAPFGKATPTSLHAVRSLDVLSWMLLPVYGIR